MKLSRRGFGRLAAAGLLAPRRLLAGTNDHQFLFVFCRGGWDPAWVLTPDLIGSPVVTDPDGTLAEAGGIPFIDNGARPSVRTLLEQYGRQCCVIHGLEIRSITHEACRRIAFTGGTDAVSDDWAARIGSGGGWPLASLVVSGPSFTNRHTSSVVRVGQDGQLGKLLSGAALTEADRSVPLLDEGTNALIDQFIAQRTTDAAAAAARGRAAAFVAGQQRALEQRALLQSIEGGLDLSADLSDGSYATIYDRARPALDSLAMGLSRCAVIEHNGEWDVGWDTHTAAEKQGDHFSVLADDLLLMLDDLDRSGLLQSTTVVVFSEMGRAPQINLTGGKDHWTYTSAMLFGGGVCGGTVIGAYDDDFRGQALDPETGQLDDGGTALTAAHLGATLLHLAGVEADAGIVPITAALC